MKTTSSKPNKHNKQTTKNKQINTNVNSPQHQKPTVTPQTLEAAKLSSQNLT